jgi:hypothetical protein
MTSAPSPERDTPTQDWAGEAARTIGRVVDGVVDKTTRPIQRVVRILIFGLVAAALGAVFVALVVIGLLRLLDSDAFSHRVWAADAVLGGIISLGGVLLLRRAMSRPSSH